MDESSHVFLIKDKIRCIQKKIMDQLAADLNSALNDANILTSPLSNVTMTSSSSATLTKIKRRRKRPVNTEMQQKQQQQQQRTEASDSTTPENSATISRYRTVTNRQCLMSDGEDRLMSSRMQSTAMVAASESDSTSQTDEIRRRRRPFKKPTPPVPMLLTSKSEQHFKLSRCPIPKSTTSNITDTTITPVRRRRRHCRSECSSRLIDVDEDPSTPSSSSSFSLTIGNTNYVGKRKRSRAIHEDFRVHNHTGHDCDMAIVDDSNLTYFSSSSSLNLSDSDKDPCPTSNEADDEQSDWPRDESSVPRVISWWEDNQQHKSENEDQGGDDDDDDEMLTTSDSTLQKIVNGALTMMLAGSKTTIRNRIKSFVHREMLTGNRRNVESKTAFTHHHSKRHARPLKEARRSHHNGYSHKRVKSDHFPHRCNDVVAPIAPSNIGHQLLQKFGWTPGTGLGLSQNGITTPVHIAYRNHKQGLGYEYPQSTLMDTSERMDSEPSSSHPHQTDL